ncbi:MAG: bifunctional (p)ppGpp synthetase/guanosine-3',5'-bis(diphosphate) 3'-pyrophosphohydrolase [Spirochaetota bacterium]
MVEKIELFAEKLKSYSETSRAKILEAVHWAEKMHCQQKRASGEPYFIHPLQVAEILVDLNMDEESIIAALLHDILEDTGISRNEMRKLFGRQVETLVNGVTKISILKAKTKNVQEAESIRKMLFAMTKDIRVILIKLADKLHNMRTLQYLPEDKRKAIARECLDIYAPLAGRLGISWVKAELEDLSLKHLHSDVYSQIKSFLAAKKSERAEYLKNIENTIRREAEKEGLKIAVKTRAKHFYSIFNKMKQYDKQLEEIYDLLGLRILCNTQNECYTLLGIVHRLWKPIEGRFKDYIAMPKANKYQSLHTTVMCYGGKLIEIQIRTHKMHRTAEYGIAAHWFYKSNVSRNAIKPKDLAIINKLKNWDGLKITSGEFLEEIKQELLEDSIYVFTPKGDIKELPKGSTPIDFAYHIHTEIGHHCIAAKADGLIVPLHAELKNTQIVEIITSNKGYPHLNWLKYVKTASARSKIRHWLNKYDDSLIIKRKSDSTPAAGESGKSPVKNLQAKEHPSRETVKRVLDNSKIIFKIGNEKNMLIRLAQCCNPTTVDAIIGYISRGRGIIVHKKVCPNLEHISDFAERNIMVEWEAVSPGKTGRFKVTARMTSDLFAEIEGAVRKFRGHLIEGKLDEDARGNLTGFFTLEMDNNNDLKKVIKSIRTIPSIMNIQMSDPAIVDQEV